MFKRYKGKLDNKLSPKLGMENSAFNFRREMNKSSKKGDIHGLFKHHDTRYMKWLKDKLDEREIRDKLISYRNDIIEANKRVNYRNQVDRMNDKIQRDNLNHNSLEHLQHQINQFKNLSFT